MALLEAADSNTDNIMGEHAPLWSLAPVYAPFIRDALAPRRDPWEVPGRRLLDYLLVYVQEGHCLFTVEETPYELGPGDFCMVQPGECVVLAGKSATVTPYAHFDLFYNPRREESFATRPGQLDLSPHRDLLQPQLHCAGLALPTVFREPALGRWHEQLERIIALFNSSHPSSRMEAAARLGAMVLAMARHFGGKRGSSSASGSTLDWVPSYFSTRLADSLTVEDMARRAGLSPSRFQFLFRKAYGTSPGQYLQRMRVDHAAELLDSTPWTLERIAALCGFANAQHFSKVFRAARGLSPGRYRSRHASIERG